MFSPPPILPDSPYSLCHNDSRDQCSILGFNLKSVHGDSHLTICMVFPETFLSWTFPTKHVLGRMCGGTTALRHRAPESRQQGKASDSMGVQKPSQLLNENDPHKFTL